jgi:dihydrofolate reductase
MRLVVSEFVSLDGIMEDPGGAEGYEHAGWHFRSWADEIGAIKKDELFASDALLLGRRTYEGFAAAWPTVKDEEGFADRMNSLPKYVVSSTLDTLEWNNSHLLEGEVIEEVTPGSTRLQLTDLGFDRATFDVCPHSEPQDDPPPASRKARQ